MDSSRSCKNCRKRTLVADDITGNLVCRSCGVVQEFDNFQAHIGGITGDAGTYVRLGTAGSGSSYNHKEIKIYEARKLIEDFVFKLGLSGSKSHEVKLLVEKITDGEYGQGVWFPVFVGACAYVVMRKDEKMLPMVEVADLVGCDVYELGRMVGRVVDFVDLKLPEFDIVKSLGRAVKNCSALGEVSEDVEKKMLQQGVFLVQCLIKWFVTTGRQPMPVVAAVLFFVAELNQVRVKIQDLAKELHVTVTTCRLRHKELLERLVGIARVLPWGKDVTVKNIMKNAPFVIQYMELKSMMKCDEETNRLEYFQDGVEGFFGDCLNKQIGYGFESYMTKDSSTQYFEVDRTMNLHIDSPIGFQISPESLTFLYSNFLDEISSIKVAAEIGMENRRKRQKAFDLEECTDWWRGKSDLSKKLLLKQVLEKDVGLDVMPPSFDKGCLAKKKRQEKIETAKQRIQRIMHPSKAHSGCSDELVFEPEMANKKRKKLEVDIDWEDFIIETLLLHDVKEDEIENGHYNALLALHVFDH